MVSRPSLKGRAALAVALLVGFYVLAFVIAAGLVYIPYAEWVFAHHITWQVVVFCIGGAFAILRGIVPRRDDFEPPGPRVTEAEQPRLFAVIREAAATTGQAMPQEVYLMSDVNAFVAQRGGLMGFGSRRVMGIGLSLLESLTVPQFRAVVAHEFGHYHGGDTKLGPWIYKTRASIIRTLQSLARHSGVLQKPFLWYGAAFSRLTLAISRQQEYVADELAARKYGVATLSEALTTLERSGTAFGAFMQQEFAGVVDAGFRPPLVEGFARFQSAPRISSQLDEVVARAIEDGEAGPYESHPSLKQRLAALAGLGDANEADAARVDDTRAIALIDDIPGAETAVIAALLKSGAPTPQPIAWDDVPRQVLSVGWMRITTPALPGLDGLTPTVFPEIAKRLGSDADALARQLGVRGSGRDPEHARQEAEAILGAALSLVLDEHRRRSPDTVRVLAPPGEPVVFHVAGRDAETRIEPFAVLEALKNGTIEPAAWLAMCSAARMDSDDLGACCRRAGEQHNADRN